MGRARRPHPERLAVKLYAVRRYFNVSPELFIELLKYNKSPLYRTHIYEFESGDREPNLLVLLKYARLARVRMEVLVDDELNLPGVLGQVTLVAEQERKSQSK